MTDNEIIKALECCTTKGAKCSDCPAFKKVDRSDYIKYFRGAIDLINSQKAEIENLKDILYDAEGVNLVNYWYQQCEIAENGNRNFDEENKKLKVEIKRLKNDISAMLVTLRNSAKATRNEAIKEFAYRLKQKSEYYENGQGWEGRICYEDDIDKLVKEMVGEE